MAEENSKLFSRTGLTGLGLTTSGTAGLILAVFPALAGIAPQGKLEAALSGLLALGGMLVMYFRKKSDGKKPQVV